MIPQNDTSKGYLKMIPQIAEILRKEQLKSVIKCAFAHNPIEILNCIAQAGRSQVVWVHFKVEQDGRRNSSFLSWKELLLAFWNWVETVNILLLAMDLKNALAKAIYAVVEPGDMVWHRYEKCWLEVLDKEESVSLKIPSLWLGDEESIGKVNAYLVTKL